MSGETTIGFSKVLLQHVFQQDRAAEHVVYRYVEEALNLLSMQIHRQNAVNPYAGEEIGNHLGGDRHTRGTHAAIPRA